MCGLFGFTRIGAELLQQEDIDRARRALNVLSHRGPDQSGEHIGNNTYLGHRRLSIIDLSNNGRQPMTSDDGEVAITVNGEIYNFKMLRRALRGPQFRSESDSEVVLHGYRRWGAAELCDRMDGMYGFVIHDRSKRQIVLVRDRAGIKPLYYAQIGDYFAWASELKAVVEFFGSGALEVDNTAIFDFLTYRYIPSPKTIYRQVRKLEPGHRLVLDCSSGEIEDVSYWRLEPSNRPVDHRRTAETLRDLISQSVDEQMMSDVPLGFFLSGGIDSSIVVGLAARLHPSPMTFSIGFDVSEHDETEYAQLVAAQFQTTQRTKILSAEDGCDLVGWMFQRYDEPFADTSALATFHVAQLAKQEVKVVLTGDGGDELFGGYRWYHRFNSWRRKQFFLGRFLKSDLGLPFYRPPSNVLEKIANRLSIFAQFEELQLYQSLFPGLTRAERAPFRELWQIPDDYDDLWSFRRYFRPELGRYKSLQFLDFHTFLPDDILTKVDRVTMSVSLEARVPFLSRALMEFAFSLPEDFIYRDGELKGGLKYSFRHLLPGEILRRSKQGFSIPTMRWGENVLAGCGTFQEAYVRHFFM